MLLFVLWQQKTQSLVAVIYRIQIIFDVRVDPLELYGATYKHTAEKHERDSYKSHNQHPAPEIVENAELGDNPILVKLTL